MFERFTVPASTICVAFAGSLTGQFGRKWVQPRVIVAPRLLDVAFVKLSEVRICPSGGMADAADSKSAAGNGVWVRLPPRAWAPPPDLLRYLARFASSRCSRSPM